MKPSAKPLFGQMTLAQKYDHAMKITDEAEARAWLEVLIEDLMTNPNIQMISRKEAAKIERRNLGYWAGYYDAETRERVERLFDCEHPYFGKIAVRGQPTPEEAFKVGFQLGEKMKHV